MIKEHTLLVIENGLTHVYKLDNRAQWKIGRPSAGNDPDIKLYLPTISRRHGMFANIDGYWFFFNESDERRTAYNANYIRSGYGGRKRPIMLSDKDCLVFGGSVYDMESNANVVSFFFDKSFDGDWRTIDAKNTDCFAIKCDGITDRFQNPTCGLLVDSKSGRAIYLGDYVYITGKVEFMEI
ncbi:FHA domain-containing protein [Butyrivibrio sp. YAB3001]|uniref:FHA domain-containing protein n=1 Tax=Butyrivibrio sp. YAB3001 TaxID=1520812 RepID=UPI0008F68EF7|nr:FHA domain-containing protein [Butyrivibrio sp. YAB3001]SFB81527.1 hypothetical protein SAMN02910398_00717 [Butyrivibrio sp. YAB3001]